MFSHVPWFGFKHWSKSSNPEKIPTKQGPRILRTIGNPREVYSIQDSYAVERGQFIDLEVKFKELEPIKKIKDV